MTGGAARTAKRVRLYGKAERKRDRFNAAPYPRTYCPQPRQEGDEYVCGKCLLRWDTHEEKPPCPK